MQQIQLHLRDNTLHFHAGQYLQIVHPDGTGIPLSAASSPLRLPQLTFHYQSTADSEDARRVDELLSQQQPLRLLGPGGTVFVTAQESGPLLLAAGGTGASQALSIIDDLVLRGTYTQVTLICCADREEDFYFREALAQLEVPWLRLEYFADPKRASDNLGMRWLSEHAGQFSNWRTILCGGPPFVYAACDALVSGGMAMEQTESDVYAYAPRASGRGA